MVCLLRVQGENEAESKRIRDRLNYRIIGYRIIGYEDERKIAQANATDDDA